jgi:type VI protein secretion system component Hcp
MKDAFLVHITLPDVFTQKFYSLIPEQKDHINSLLEKQIVLSYSMDMERKNVWIYIQAYNEQEVMELLSAFPIIREVKVTVHELAFHSTANKAMPDLIMN